jgi:hypothetical protein
MRRHEILISAALAALSAAPAAAQPEDADEPPPLPLDAPRSAAGGARPGTILVDYAEIHAGPGAAYVSRGRVYQGDRVRVLQRDETGGWMEVESGGLRGWVRTRFVELGEGGGEAPRDAGRDRRETNYRYDERGRRLFPDGRPMGSGEGAGEVADDGDEAAPDRRGGLPLPAVRLSLLAAGLDRTFQSNIGQGSALRDLSAAPAAYGVELAVDWAPLRYVAVRGVFRDLRFADATVPANPAFGFDDPVTMAVDAQEGALDVIGRYPILDGWIGAYAGAHVLRTAFQATQPFAIFLDYLYVGLGAGGAAGYTLGPVDLTVRGGVVLPLSVSQSPQEGGDASSDGATVSGEVAWRLTPAWAVVGSGFYTALTTDITGGGTHQDSVTRDPPAGYDAARATDTALGGGLGVRWSP